MLLNAAIVPSTGFITIENVRAGPSGAVADNVLPTGVLSTAEIVLSLATGGWFGRTVIVKDCGGLVFKPPLAFPPVS